ncbi:MAG: hypothetical protein J0I42_13585 [Bosea sp.]|uniref:hypothetical protein n=1 Tax=Bosea sp. (in: a-proteobacteria) TaxID=1871050 RepID=UPI001AD5B1CA|nr:hypothetical protein [Bosea sp. (in: a-proteobacteria)]MBN9452975.1 hypothetical protein [Bosea sp. (in: a-proteobacteria)]
MSLIVSMARPFTRETVEKAIESRNRWPMSPFRQNLALGRPAAALTQRKPDNSRFAEADFMDARLSYASSRRASATASLMVLVSIIIGSAAALAALVPLT